MRIVTDSVDRFIRAILRETEEFKPNSIRYFDMDFERGILMAVGVLNTSERGDSAIAQIIFNKELNTFESVKQYIAVNKVVIWDAQEVEFSAIEPTDEMTYSPKNQEVYSMAKTISGVKIFKVGVHNQTKFTLTDLKEMVANYKRLKKENEDFQIPIKIGHDAPMESEKAAVGWMQNLSIEGDFLIADFVDLSDDVFSLIKEKRFKNRSIELFRNFKNAAGEVIGKVVKGIALLGSSLPAVNLPDIAFHFVPESILAFGQNQESEIFSDGPNGEEETVSEPETEPGAEAAIDKGILVKEDVMSDTVEEVIKEEVIEKDEAFKLKEEKLAWLSKFENQDEVIEKLERLEKIEKENTEKEAAFAITETQRKQDEVDTFVGDLVKANKVLPKDEASLKNLFFHLYNGDTIEMTFKHGEKKNVQYVDLFKNFLEALPDQGLFSNVATVGKVTNKSREEAMIAFAAKQGHAPEDVQTMNIGKYKEFLTKFEKEFKEEN